MRQAASILEEEIAAGIVAAKQFEGRIMDVEGLRAGKPDDVVQRLRRDAHDVVDILVDLVHAATKSAGGLARRVVNIRTEGRSTSKESGGRIPTVTMDHPVRAGESAATQMAVENDSDQATDTFRFHVTELVNGSGDRISPSHVAFEPASVTLGPHAAERVVVTVTPPEITPPGLYSGLLQTTKLDHVRAILVIQVV